MTVIPAEAGIQENLVPDFRRDDAWTLGPVPGPDPRLAGTMGKAIPRKR